MSGAVADARLTRPDPHANPTRARPGFTLTGDLRIQIFGALFGLGTIHHELQFLLEQQRTGPLANYMERWGLVKPTIGWPSEVGIALHLIDLVLGILLLVLPYRRVLLMVLGPAFALVNLVSPERIPSHNSLMLGAFAVLLVFGLAEVIEGAIRGGRPQRGVTDWYGWTLTGLTWLCALTYAFAALHKLNSTFLSLADSTAPPFALLFVEPLGISRETALGLLGYPAIYGTLAIEAALPILLMRRCTRLLGCFVGLSFHLAMMARGIMDFPTIILAFYPLFMSAEEVRALLSRCTGWPSPLRLATAAALAAVGTVTIARSAYVHDLYANSANLEPILMWAHSIFLYATFVWFAYVTSTVGTLLLDRRSAGATAPAAA